MKIIIFSIFILMHFTLYGQATSKGTDSTVVANSQKFTLNKEGKIQGNFSAIYHNPADFHKPSASISKKAIRLNPQKIKKDLSGEPILKTDITLDTNKISNVIPRKGFIDTAIVKQKNDTVIILKGPKAKIAKGAIKIDTDKVIDRIVKDKKIDSASYRLRRKKIKENISESFSIKPSMDFEGNQSLDPKIKEEKKIDISDEGKLFSKHFPNHQEDSKDTSNKQKSQDNNSESSWLKSDVCIRDYVRMELDKINKNRLSKDSLKYFEENLNNQFFYEYLKVLKKEKIQPVPLDKEKMKFYSSLFAQNEIDINAVIVKDDCCKDKFIYSEDVAQKLFNIHNYFKDIDCYFDLVIEKNIPWINHWLWFTEGKIRLNPFGVYDPSKQLADNKQQLLLLKKEFEILEKRIACCEIDSEEYKSLKEEYSKKLNAEKQLLSTIAKLEEVQVKFKEWKEEVTLKDDLVYEFKNLPTSKKDKITWIHHYDASEDFKFLNSEKFSRKDRTFELPYSVFEKDNVRVAIHNIKSGDKISLKASEQTITLRSKFEIELDPWSNTFAEAFKGIPDISKITEIIKPFFPNQVKSDNRDLNFNKKFSTDSEEKKIVERNIEIAGNDREKLRENVSSQYSSSLREIVEEYMSGQILSDSDFNDYILEYRDILPKLKWLQEQTEPYLGYKLEEDKTPKYRTEIMDPEKTLPKKGNEVSYEIFAGEIKDSIKVISKKYIKHNLFSVYPTIGVGYVLGSRVNSTFNEKSGQFDKDFEIDNIEAFAGVKWYPWKMNITNDGNTRRYIRDKFSGEANKMRGNSILNRVSLTLAFGLRHSLLKNYVVAAGYDIIPGLSLQVGGNLFFQNRYKLDNNNVIDRVETPVVRGFVSFSVDLGIATKLVKIFSKSAL